MNKLYILTSCLFLLINTVSAQLFIDNGTEGGVYITTATGGTAGSVDATTNVALYVDGDITNEGTYSNTAAETQLTGNISNSGTFTTTGDEVLLGGNTQAVNGDFTGANDFNNLLIDKTASTLVDLNADIEITTTGELEFVTGGIIRTNANHVYLKNTAASSLNGYAASGAADKYVEGTIRRAVASGTTYDLPTGDAVHNLQMAQINFAALSGASYVEASYDNSTFGAVVATQTCSSDGGPANDIIDYDEQLGTWTITADGTNGAYDYTATLAPAGANVFSAAIHDAMLKDGVFQHCSDATGNYSKAGLTSFSTFTMLGGTVIALPIKLLSIDANAIDNDYIAVNWEVATQENAFGFDIQRSVNGIDFEKIGFVKSEETVMSYGFDDKNALPNQNYYYRLKMLDIDGRYEYSDIVDASLRKQGFEVISITNPIKFGNASVVLSTNSDQKVTFVVSNVLGQVLNQQVYDLSSGVNTLDLSTENWSSGTYFLMIATENTKVVKKLVFIE